jgi:hypothetical protein
LCYIYLVVVIIFGFQYILKKWKSERDKPMILNVQCGFNPIQSASFHYVWRFEPINLLNPRHFYWSSYWSTPVKIAVMYICIRVLGVSILPLFNYDVVLYWSCSDSLVLPLFNCDVVLYWSLVCFVLYWSCSDNLVCFVFHFISTCYLYFPIFFCLMVLNTTFNHISAISWRSVLLVEETEGPGENHRPVFIFPYRSMLKLHLYVLIEFRSQTM